MQPLGASASGWVFLCLAERVVTCAFCQIGRKNLCDQAMLTGCHLDGGYAEYVVADQRFCFLLPAALSDTEAAPSLCAGLIGCRALQRTQGARHLGFMVWGRRAFGHSSRTGTRSRRARFHSTG